MPPKPCICRFARACCGCDARPGYSTAPTSGCRSSQCAISRAFSQCRCMRKCERLQAAQRQEAIERAGHGAHGVLQEAQPLGERRVSPRRRPRHAADHVGMAVEILGRRVQHEVEAQLQRPLDARAGEGVVGGRDDAVRAARSPRRVPGRPASAADWSAFRPRSCASRGRIAARHLAGSLMSTKLNAQARRAAAHALEQTIGAAVQIVARHHVRAGIQQIEDGGRARPARRQMRSPRVPPSRSATQRLVGEARGIVRCGRSRSPYARRGSAARRSRWRRSGS